MELLSLQIPRQEGVVPTRNSQEYRGIYDLIYGRELVTGWRSWQSSRISLSQNQPLNVGLRVGKHGQRFLVRSLGRVYLQGKNDLAGLSQMESELAATRLTVHYLYRVGTSCGDQLKDLAGI